MLELVQGNLLDANAEALVNTVNCVGVMGKGIALQFKQAFPQMFDAYRKAAKAGDIEVGRMHVVETGLLDNPRYIVNFPTKRHWRARSRLEDVEAGLRALVSEVRRMGIQSIAIPPLGCGYGGLSWQAVRPLIESAFADLDGVRVLLFEPTGAPAAKDRTIRTTRPSLTRARALYLLLMDRYGDLGYRRTLLEIQKLAYFLQAAGEPLKLRFTEGPYGPYADNLNKVLERLEGHFTSGFDGERAPDREIDLLPGSVAEARAFLDEDALASALLDRVAGLIEGFETPYGMELLATVHWVASRDANPATTSAEAMRQVQAWSPRKRRIFRDQHVATAWKRLDDAGWLTMVGNA